MKKTYRCVVAVVIAFAIVIGTLFCNTIDSHATHMEASITDKIMDIPIKPYGGLTVYDAFPNNAQGTFSHTNMYLDVVRKCVEKSTGKELKYTDFVESGKTYTITLTIRSYKGNLPKEIKISDYSCNIYRYSDPSDKSFVSNIQKKVVDDYNIVLTFDVAVGAKPDFNRGTVDFSFTKDVTSIDVSDSVFDYFIAFLSNESYHERIGKRVAADKSYRDYDINNDGEYDLRVSYSSEGDYISISRLTESSISGDYTYVMPEEDRKEYEAACKYYCGELIIHFSKLDSNNTTNNSDDNNNSNNTNNNSNDSNSNNTNKNSNSSNSNNQNNGSNNASNNNDTNKSTGNSSSGGSSDSSTGITYENEWVNGQWFGINGDTSYTPQGSWKSNSTGWWFEDTSGWYPQSQWVKIDGKWYYFTADGYMDYSEYRDGCWLGSDGAWVEEYYGGHWCSDSTGWWYEDNAGWYPANQWLWIDGYRYWFGANGYWSE